MEYASGGDLLKYVKCKTYIQEEEAMYIFYQIAAGLRYIHRQGFIHRDIKLDNILLDSDNNCKICDFGVSKQIKPNDLNYE